MVGQLTAGAGGCLPIRSRCRRVYEYFHSFGVFLRCAGVFCFSRVSAKFFFFLLFFRRHTTPKRGIAALTTGRRHMPPLYLRMAQFSPHANSTSHAQKCVSGPHGVIFFLFSCRATGMGNHGTRFEIFFGGYGYVTTQDGTSRSEIRVAWLASVGDRAIICPQPLRRAIPSVSRAWVVGLKLAPSPARAYRRSQGAEHALDLRSGGGLGEP